MNKYKIILAIAVAAVLSAVNVYAIEPAELVFVQKQGGKYIYCNNHELIRSSDLADKSVENAKFLMNNENLQPDKYAFFASFLNRTDIDKNDKSSGGRGFDIELDVMFRAEEDTIITIERLGFEVPEHRNVFLGGNTYSTEDEWGCFDCWSSYLQMPIKQINSGNVYEGSVFNEVTFSVEAGETVWLSEFIDNYREIPFCRSVNIMTDFVIESGACDVNVAAFRSDGTLKDRTRLSPNASYGSYYRDRQYKGISNGLNEVNTKVVYTVGDSDAAGKLPVKVYNQYKPEGNVITDWYTHLNPRADQWSYDLCTESDMLSFEYYDPNKTELYGKGIPETERDNIYRFDTKHTDISVYNKAYGSQYKYVPNRELTEGEGTQYACNLGNYGVIYNYDMEITNTGNKRRYLIYKLATSSNNLVYVKDADGNVVDNTVYSKGRKQSRISDDMACVALPAQKTTKFSVCVILTPNYAGGMQNCFYLSDTPSLIETYTTERSSIEKDKYFTGKEYYSWNGGILNFSTDKENWYPVNLPSKVMDGIRGNLNQFSVIYTGDGYMIRPSLYDAGVYYHADHLFRDVYLLDSDFNLKAQQRFGAYPQSAVCANGVYYVKLSGTVFRSGEFKWWDVTDFEIPCWNYGTFSAMNCNGNVKLSSDGKEFADVVYTAFKPGYIDSYGQYYYYRDGRKLYLSKDGMYWDMFLFTENFKTFTVRGNVVVSDKGEQHILPKTEAAAAIFFDGKYIALGNKPLLHNENVMIPLRNLCEYLGYEVIWNGTETEIRNGETTAKVTDAVILNEVSYVTADVLEKLTGYDVTYNPVNRTVYIK